MAYQTGSVQNTYELYDAFSVWMTGSSGPGWNDHAQPGWNSAGTGSTDVRDLIFQSSGSDANQSLTYRATFLNPVNMNSSSNHQGITASIGTKRPAAVHNVFDYIIFRGYLNWPNGSTINEAGTSSFGTLGPALYQFPARADLVNSPSPITVFNYSSSTGKFNQMQQNDQSQYPYTKLGNSAWGMDQAMWGWFDNLNFVGPNCSGLWDDRRRNYYVSNTRQTINSDGNWNSYTANYRSVGFYDLANGNTQAVAGAGDPPSNEYTGDNGPNKAGTEDNQQRNSVLVYDKDTQEEWIYYFAYNETSWFRKINLKTSVTTLLTNPGLGAKGNQTFYFVWDGNDYIYKFGPYNSNNFERYLISGDSWTTMDTLPATLSWQYGINCEVVYIPHSASQATLTNSVGNPTDVIYMARGNNYQTVYRYDVSNDNWITDVNMPLNFEYRYDKMWWDGQERLWFHDYSDYNIYYRNISSSADYETWTEYQDTFMNSATPYSGSQDCQLMPVDGPCSKIRGQQESYYQSSATKMNYWFQGDQDAINIVTETSGNFYWAHFGTYDSIVSTTTMKSTAAFVAGTIVTVPVESTTGFVTGQEVIFADVSGSATVEKNQILEIVNSTSFKVSNLSNSFSSGTLVGTDPHQAVATGDSFLAVTSLDGGGYRTDKMSSMYKVIPGVPYQLMRASNTNAQGFYTPWPLIMYNNTHDLATYEAKGMLKNCWVMQSVGNYPSLVSGDSLNIGGTSYKIFPLEETTTLMGNNIDKLLLLIKTE